MPLSPESGDPVTRDIELRDAGFPPARHDELIGVVHSLEQRGFPIEFDRVDPRPQYANDDEGLRVSLHGAHDEVRLAVRGGLSILLLQLRAPVRRTGGGRRRRRTRPSA